MIYFDNAATSYPKPKAVTHEMERALLEAGGNPGRSSHPLAMAAAELVYDCRAEVADFFGFPDPEAVIFCQNATMALNLAIKSRAERGMHLLISDREHNAVLRPVYRLSKDGAVSFDIFRCEHAMEDLYALTRRNTSILVLNHVSNVTGREAPIEEIGRFCRRHGIYLIIDASQSAGHQPIDLSRLHFDAFCAPAHKGLLGIPGAGFVILKRSEHLSSFLEGGSGVHSLDPEMPHTLPERYEAGTLPTVAIAALRAGLCEVKRMGTERIQSHESALKARLVRGMRAFPDVRLYEEDAPGGLLSFNCLHLPADRVGEALAEQEICVRTGYHCAPLAHRAIGTLRTGTVRVSLGLYNTEGEIDRFLDAMDSILSKKTSLL